MGFRLTEAVVPNYCVRCEHRSSGGNPCNGTAGTTRQRWYQKVVARKLCLPAARSSLGLALSFAFGLPFALSSRTLTFLSTSFRLPLAFGDVLILALAFPSAFVFPFAFVRLGTGNSLTPTFAGSTCWRRWWRYRRPALCRHVLLRCCSFRPFRGFV